VVVVGLGFAVGGPAHGGHLASCRVAAPRGIVDITPMGVATTALGAIVALAGSRLLLEAHSVVTVRLEG
jgi:hypothetical protein